MKKFIAAGAVGGLVIAAAQAERERPAPEPARVAPRAPEKLDWSEWTRPIPVASAWIPAAADTGSEGGTPAASSEDVDVVDAHWMALTMWGEGRNQGEEGMRAVGHVIHNRWLTGRGGAYVTGTVSEAWQFSCWNEGDPNRAAILNVETLSRSSPDYRLWLAAKTIAAEILAGRSADPTGGALFYHTEAIRPAWSAGVAPIARIGSHLFFRTVR